MSWCLVFRGYPDQAVSRSNQALDWSRKLRNSNVLAFALLHASICLQLQRADEAALEVLKEQIPLCTEQRFPVYLALAHLMQGYLLATRGETEQGLALARAGFQNLTATGFLLGRPYYLGFLVQSCARAGEVDEAFELIDQALAETEQTSERWVEAELLRLKGEWLTTHQRGGYARPEVYLEQAISVAQAQGARLLELRSIVSLCRCLGKHGRSAELRKLLMPICNSFQEGFGTPDLQDARLILSSLT